MVKQFKLFPKKCLEELAAKGSSTFEGQELCVVEMETVEADSYATRYNFVFAYLDKVYSIKYSIPVQKSEYRYYFPIEGEFVTCYETLKNQVQ